MKTEVYKKLTDEFKKEFTEKIASQQFIDFIAKANEAKSEDYGTFKVIISTADKDRQGESVVQSGWDLSFYKLNPVVLWAHDYSSMPIGVCTSIEVINNQLVAEGKFAPTEFAQDVRKLYDLGMVRTTSVGFIAREWDQNNNDIILRAELLEFSFVPVPANPYALSMNQIKELKLDLALLKTKGMEFEIKADEPAPAPAPEATPPAPASEPAPSPEATPAPVVPAEPAPDATKAGDPTAEEVRMRSIMKEVYNHLTSACTALKDYAESEGGKGISDGDSKADGDKGSKSSQDELSEMERFLRNRELVKTVNIALGKVLRDYNRADRYQKAK